mgnify:CR=1 FL=1
MKGYLKQDGEPTPDKPIKIEAKIPMFVDGELENFDNNIHSIIEEYSKMIDIKVIFEEYPLIRHSVVPNTIGDHNAEIIQLLENNREQLLANV